MNVLPTLHGDLTLPAFLPDATRGAVRTVDAADIARCGVAGLMVNVLHLASEPGTNLIAQMGGIHTLMGWDGPIASDSGGFQALSLAIGPQKLGAVSDSGFRYSLAKGWKKRTLTPDKCIQKQFQLGADIMFCLDHCTHPDMDRRTQEESVKHTLAWAKQCKDAFAHRLDHYDRGARPFLFAVVQGGADRELRRRCAESLLETGFDGYGFGGWPVNAEGGLVEMVSFVRELIPPEFPLHGLGIGKPENLVEAHALGYDLFDCVLPTRDARHQRLYAFVDHPDRVALDSPGFYEFVQIKNEVYARDRRPVDETCDCLCCKRYSRAYLHHLFQVKEPVAARLATIHNLRFYVRLTIALQDRTQDGRRLGPRQKNQTGSAPKCALDSSNPENGRQELVAALKQSKKYRDTCGETLWRIADWASSRHRSPQHAVKSAKRKLHQICGAYVDRRNLSRVDDLVQSLPESRSAETLESACRDILSLHTSTAERLACLDKVFTALFEKTGFPKRILDLACGLNPFAWPWMGLPEEVHYEALDIDARLCKAVNAFFDRIGRPQTARCQDILASPPDEPADVALLFKTAPCLERQQRGATRGLLETLNVQYAVVSFPKRSLGGRRKGMVANYGHFMENVCAELGIPAERIAIPTEAFFILDMKRRA